MNFNATSLKNKNHKNVNRSRASNKRISKANTRYITNY